MTQETRTNPCAEALPEVFDNRDATNKHLVLVPAVFDGGIVNTYSVNPFRDHQTGRMMHFISLDEAIAFVKHAPCEPRFKSAQGCFEFQRVARTGKVIDLIIFEVATGAAGWARRAG